MSKEKKSGDSGVITLTKLKSSSLSTFLICYFPGCLFEYIVFSQCYQKEQEGIAFDFNTESIMKQNYFKLRKGSKYL